jgi:SAM-dependent methyltransferase
VPRFDDGYYQRFYGELGAHDPERLAHLAAAVHEMCAWWGVPVQSVLDVGAGVGMWRDWYRREHPEVHVRSLDISEHACATWGHELRDIATWRPDAEYDLVICHSVLQYLPDALAVVAIEHLAAATRWVLYLEAPTGADLADLVDPERTDMDVHGRSAAWYHGVLDPFFQQVGAGLWITRGTIPMYELEAATP